MQSVHSQQQQLLPAQSLQLGLVLHVLLLGKHDLRINALKFQAKELVLLLEEVVSLGKHWDRFLEGMWEEFAQSLRTGWANVLSEEF